MKSTIRPPLSIIPLPFYARDVNYVTPDLFDDLAPKLDTIIHDLNRVIATIRSRLTKGGP